MSDDTLVHGHEGAELSGLVVLLGGAPIPIIEFRADGRIFWRGREVDTDDLLRKMVRDWMKVPR